MSPLRTIRPLEQATFRSRVGRTSQPFTTAAFTVLVRAGAGSRPFRRRHALGESDCSLHIARSFEKTRCPRFLSPSNKALATAPFPSGMVARFPEAPNFVLKPKGRAFRRLRTMFNDVWAALVDEPMSQLHGCATRLLNLLGPD